MNLGEAEKSFDYFAELLKMQSGDLTLAVALAESASTEVARQAIENRDEAVSALKATCKSAQALDIVVSKAMAKDAERMVSAPIEVAKVVMALNRLTQATQEARRLIEEQESSQNKISEPQRSAASIETLEALKKVRRELAEAAAERRRKRQLDG